MAWKDNCDHFGLHLTPEILVELAGKSVDELFDILSERSGRTGQVDRKQVMTMIICRAWFEIDST